MQLIFSMQKVNASGSGYNRITNAQNSTITMPSLHPDFIANSGSIKIIKASNNGFSLNNGTDPNTFVLVGNELYWLLENALQPIAVFTDVNNDETRNKNDILDIIDVQVKQTKYFARIISCEISH